MKKFAKYTALGMNLSVLNNIIETHSEDQITKVKLLTKNKIINNIQCKTLYSTKFLTNTLNVKCINLFRKIKK